MDYKFKYAGIGSRTAPDRVLKLCTKISECLDKRGGLLRSGGALGCDTAFEAGTSNKEIFTAKQEIPQEAFVLAKRFHPNWDACTPYARRLHARNQQIVLGKNLNDPVAFIVYWRNPKVKFSGTDQGIRTANAYKVPVFDLAKEDALVKLGDFIFDNGF